MCNSFIAIFLLGPCRTGGAMTTIPQKTGPSLFGFWCYFGRGRIRNASHSREKLALSLPKGGNPVQRRRLSEDLRSEFPLSRE
jgi:hypothetical protein